MKKERQSSCAQLTRPSNRFFSIWMACIPSPSPSPPPPVGGCQLSPWLQVTATSFFFHKKAASLAKTPGHFHYFLCAYDLSFKSRKSSTFLTIYATFPFFRDIFL
ncbi:hypothetical protein BDE02_09G090100 [Populus trichocarpa]|nr:hypothetical protein BDE02_09G090100 [Populus trichocarpa]